MIFTTHLRRYFVASVLRVTDAGLHPETMFRPRRQINLAGLRKLESGAGMTDSNSLRTEKIQFNRREHRE